MGPSLLPQGAGDGHYASTEVGQKAMILINELNCQESLGSSLFISGCFQNGKNQDCFHFGNNRLNNRNTFLSFPIFKIYLNPSYGQFRIKM